MNKRICAICNKEFIPKDKRQTSRCSEIHYRECETCKKSFEITSSMRITVRFCSRECRSVNDRRRVKKCEVCGKPILNRSRAANTCSKECSLVKKSKTNLKKTLYCDYCGEIFNSVSLSSKYCDRVHYSLCEVCNSSFEVDVTSHVPRTCSNKCRGVLVNNAESDLKRQKTSLKNWGTIFPQQSEIIKDKIAKVNIEKYGHSSPFGSPELRAKGLKTNLERYGYEWPRQFGETKVKAESTNLERYGAINPFGSKVIQDKIRETLFNKYGDGGVEFSKISKLNRSVAKSIADRLGVSVEFERPFGGKYSADLFVDGKILVDINPTVSHNSHVSFACIVRGCAAPCSEHEPVDRNYHFYRAKAAFEEDLSLVQWYEWDTVDKLVKFLDGKVTPGFRKFSARKLRVEQVSQKFANEFFREYHVQGGGREQVYCFGLFSGSEVLSIATFGKPRFGGGWEWEFIRYAVKSGVVVHGGAGLLFKEFLSSVAPKTVVSYVDFSHTTRKSIFLGSLGFVEKKFTGPSLVWYRELDGKVVRGTSLLKIGADRVLGTNYGPRSICGLDNSEIMLLEGFLPVYIAGNRVFIYNNS